MRGDDAGVIFENDISCEVAKKLRVVDQEFVDSTFFFNVNGECHGKKIFKKDLTYSLQGKRVIKSLQDRLIQAQDYIHVQLLKADPNAEKHAAKNDGKGA